MLIIFYHTSKSFRGHLKSVANNENKLMTRRKCGSRIILVIRGKSLINFIYDYNIIIAYNSI